MQDFIKELRDKYRISDKRAVKIITSYLLLVSSNYLLKKYIPYDIEFEDTPQERDFQRREEICRCLIEYEGWFDKLILKLSISEDVCEKYRELMLTEIRNEYESYQALFSHGPMKNFTDKECKEYNRINKILKRKNAQFRLAFSLPVLIIVNNQRSQFHVISNYMQSVGTDDIDLVKNRGELFDC